MALTDVQASYRGKALQDSFPPPLFPSGPLPVMCARGVNRVAGKNKGKKDLRHRDGTAGSRQRGPCRQLVQGPHLGERGGGGGGGKSLDHCLPGPVQATRFRR